MRGAAARFAAAAVHEAAHRMIAVVTGSSGFIGGHLLRTLLARGATVRALMRPQSASDARVAGVTYFDVDVLDAAAVRDSGIWNDATHVFHLAGATTASSLAAFRRGNVTPVAHILQALAERALPPRLVLVSSQAAAGPARDKRSPVRESDEPRPLEHYGRSKLEAERVAHTYMDRLAITIVRPPSVYGPRDRDFLAAYKQAIHRVALFASPPDNEIDLLHVADVVEALLTSGQHPAAVDQTYFLSASRPLSWRQLYQFMASLARTSPYELVVPAPLLRVVALVGDVFGLVTHRTPLLNSQKLTLGNARYWLCDSSRIRNELGWRPAFTPQEGLRETYNWYVAEGWLPPGPESVATRA
jgi:nucleoside-diphosphate-sugar epimerase